MKGILIDSDILIELLRRNRGVTSRFESLLNDDIPLFHSAISITEIAHGARDSESAAIAALMAFSTCLAGDCVIAAAAGAILKRFHKSHSVGLGDAYIAATALHYYLLLWTRNRKHYPHPGLAFVEGAQAE